MDDKKLWDDFVESSLNGSLFHKWDFLNIIEKHSNTKLLSYVIYKGDKILALFPLFVGKKTILNMVMSPPFSFSPYLGPIINFEFIDLKQDKKESLLNSMTQEVSSEIKKFSPDYMRIKVTPGFSDIRSFKWEGYNIDPYYTYIIDLNHNLDELWNNLKKSCRKDIRAVEDKLILKKSQDFSELYKLVKSRYGEQRIAAPSMISSSFLTEINEKFKDNLDLFYLYHKDRVISSQLIAKYRNVYLTWIGSVKTKDIRGGNEYLSWELMKIAKSEGYEKFELHGANTINLCEFKSKFNPALDMGFDIYKKSIKGYVGEGIYLKFLKR
mgnify:CR=1 FL=1|jgi:hypothetical protein